MKSIRLQLEDLSCPSCIVKIEKAVGGLNGVEDAKVLFNASRVKVKFDENESSEELITETIEKLGFEVIKKKRKTAN